MGGGTWGGLHNEKIVPAHRLGIHDGSMLLAIALNASLGLPYF
jgi:hypothetical protein